MSMTELEQLRKRVTAQRRELRRLNKYYDLYWNGYNRGMNAESTVTLRYKMIKAFGQAAKFNAEYAEYLARPAVQMPNAIPEAEAEAAIAALIKVADAAIGLHQK